VDIADQAAALDVLEGVLVSSGVTGQSGKANPGKANPKREPPAQAPGQDHSAKMFRWVLGQLQKGVHPDVVTLALREPARLSHHDPADWPRRTVHNALHYLGARPDRYSSPKGR
jgi:hypothetical protein